MLTNISLVTLHVTDQDDAKKFYCEVLGFVEGTDVTMGEGFRWVTVKHPAQPELEVTLMVPGPPLTEDMADAVRRSLAAGTMGGFGPRPTTATPSTPAWSTSGWSSCSRRPSAPTAWRRSCATTPATGSSSSSPAPSRRPSSTTPSGGPTGHDRRSARTGVTAIAASGARAAAVNPTP